MNNPHTRLILLASSLMLLLAFALYGVHIYLSAAAVCGLILMLLGFFAGWHIGYQDASTLNTRQGRRIPVNGRTPREIAISEGE